MDDREAYADRKAGGEAFGHALDKGAVAVPQTRWRGSQGSSNVIKRVFHAENLDRNRANVNPRFVLTRQPEPLAF
ncbi:hypothetical protein FJ492_24110 [Mesorhizobium sp. B2-5-4]|uniref:hypothetical protein n=1 Tax=unclassified Mesorhizobium TaxID=325217 RepID=UPI00112AD618|nr:MULTISPECIES: hypothetical protein [unclassified Mesorhizobium]TPJ83303.1 hypothetical protein FJ434_20085 [Mesorhizobium sp. B2-5-13]TPK38304.1 hypothetical protein FJ492_24110 [Mesorhizobium sp. B2-5-4]TPK44449.1 hypothetical protein FJ560_22985 [Mesorhizobium sp. B2-5-5]